MNDNLFNINFRLLSIWYLPTFLRAAVLKTFVWILIYPLETLYIQILKNRKQNLIKMNHNYQKFSLQKRLNDAFDPVERRIIIIKAVIYESVYLYTEAEDDQFHSKTKWLHGDQQPIYLYTDAELYSEFDFIVKIPNSGINEMQLRAEIEYYMLQSKNYKIEFI